MSRQLLLEAEANTQWPISLEQQSHWFLEQVDPGNPAHNLCYKFKLKGMLDVSAVENSLNAIVSRHQVLRTHFSAADEGPCPTIRPHESIKLEMIDLTASPISERNAEDETHFVRHITRDVFDLSRDRLYRFGLLKYSSDEHVLIATFHHIIFDGWSRKVFRNELMHLYRYFAKREGSLLPPLPIQYDAFVERQARMLSSKDFDVDLKYWKRRFGGEIPELHLARDFSKPGRQSLSGVSHPLRLSESLSGRLKRLAREEGATMFILLLTALNILLYRYTGQEELVVGCPVSGRRNPISGRRDPELESLIGVFVNTLVIRTEWTGELTAKEALRKVKSVVLEAFRHQTVPYSRLVAELGGTHGHNGRTLFQVMLNYLNASHSNKRFAGLAIEECEDENDAAVVDLTLKVIETEGNLKCSFIYDNAMFREETIVRMSEHFLKLLEEIARAPELPIARLEMLSPSEKQQLLYDWNRSNPAYPTDKCAHELFEQQYLLNPNGIALLHGGERMTYAQLEQRSNQLANYLREAGVGPEQTVAVCLDRSMDLVASYLAVLKAGGAYVPVDTGIPTSRMAHMLNDAKVSVVLCVKDALGKLPSGAFKMILLDQEAEAIGRMSETCPHNLSKPDHLAYVMYTSGSTGLPKGVAVPHRGIVRLVKNDTYLKFGSDQTILQQTSISFDPSVVEIFGALLNGGRLVLPKDNQPSLAGIGEEIHRHGVTILLMVPDMLNQLLEVCGAKLASLRQVNCGGDAMPVWLKHKFAKVLPECRLINVYGPTENSVVTTYYPVEELDGELSVPIGRPISGDRVYILDPYHQPVPIGVAGELYVSGDGLALGYYGNESLSEDKFIPNPFEASSGSKMYATGDMARYRADGNIEFLGRKDFQVKIRGCRIELGEVEAIVDQQPTIHKSVARAWKNEAGAYQLVVYVVMEPEAEFDRNRILRYLRDKMPPYMVPSYLVELPSFPMTPFGKIDRKRLPEPEAAQSEEETVPPRTETEVRLHRIWTQLLGISSFGVTDSFFHLGGHSLLAMRLFTEIELIFGKKLHVSLIYREDTIERLAKALAEDPDVLSGSSMVEMQPHGKRMPLYCVHDVNGEVLVYRNVVSELGHDQPVFGFRDTRELGADTSIRSYAAKYVNEIRKRQPAGPYGLIGFSLGGMIAYEMAQLLREQGQEVALLAIVDTRNPKYFGPPRQRLQLIKLKLRSMFIKYGLLSITPVEEKERQEYRYIRAAIAAYDPAPYPGRIVLFQAEDTVDKGHGWMVTGTGSVDVHRMPGDHAFMMDKLNAKRIANVLKAELR